MLLGRSEGKSPLGRSRRWWGIILRWIFRKWDVGHGLDRAGSGWGQVTGNCECGNEPSSCMKCGELLD